MIAGRTVVLQLVVLCFATALAAWHWQGPTIERPRPDMVRYMALYDGDPPGEVEPPFRYRIWTPWLAAHAPGPPGVWLDPGRPLNRQRAHFRFATVNAIGLFLAALGLARLTARLLDSPRCGWFAAGIFLTSYFPLTLATLPMVEAWSWAFLVWSLAMLLERRHLALGLIFLFGLSCKETTLLVLPAAVLLVSSRAERLRQAAALLPGVAVYAVWRFLVLPPDVVWLNSVSGGVWLHDMFVTGERLRGNAARSFLAFHLWWIPALAAWWNRRGESTSLTRWGWLVPAILAIPFFVPLVVGRVWFFAFPFVIPLAVAGIRDRLRRPEGSHRAGAGTF